jgi:hypothetical protein
MKAVTSCLILAIVLTTAASAAAAVTSTSTRGLLAHDLDSLISATDALNGLIGVELPGDTGWHPANPASADSLLPTGLPAFTDGVGELGSGLTGLLNDFPEPRGVPVKLVEYALAAPTDVERIHILSGNNNNADGRIFSTTVVRYSTDDGSTFNELGYFQSAPSGAINNETGGGTSDRAMLVEIFDDATTVMLPGVTHLQFDFYSVDNTQGENRDPFDGDNPFTGVDDGLTAAFVSPLIWEIDVLGPAAGGSPADFDGDNVVDGADFLIWQLHQGTLGAGSPATGDATGDNNVDAADLQIWKNEFAGSAAAAIPEPCTAALVAAALALLTKRARRAAPLD